MYFENIDYYMDLFYDIKDIALKKNPYSWKLENAILLNKDKIDKLLISIQILYNLSDKGFL